MARLTVEDCLPHVGNRFDLVLLAARRARQIAMGSRPLLDEEGDKATVLALREIAAGKMSTEILEAIEAKERPSVPDASDIFADPAPGAEVEAPLPPLEAGPESFSP